MNLLRTVSLCHNTSKRVPKLFSSWLPILQADRFISSYTHLVSSAFHASVFVDKASWFYVSQRKWRGFGLPLSTCRLFTWWNLQRVLVCQWPCALLSTHRQVLKCERWEKDIGLIKCWQFFAQHKLRNRTIILKVSFSNLGATKNKFRVLDEDEDRTPRLEEQNVEIYQKFGRLGPFSLPWLCLCEVCTWLQKCFFAKNVFHY